MAVVISAMVEYIFNEVKMTRIESKVQRKIVVLNAVVSSFLYMMAYTSSPAKGKCCQTRRRNPRLANTKFTNDCHFVTLEQIPGLEDTISTFIWGRRYRHFCSEATVKCTVAAHLVSVPLWLRNSASRN